VGREVVLGSIVGCVACRRPGTGVDSEERCSGERPSCIDMLAIVSTHLALHRNLWKSSMAWVCEVNASGSWGRGMEGQSRGAITHPAILKVGKLKSLGVRSWLVQLVIVGGKGGCSE
jgi:hypothetical protein